MITDTDPTTLQPIKSHLGLIMRLLTGAGTPRERHARAAAWLFMILLPKGGLIGFISIAIGDQSAALAVSIQPDPCG